MTEKSKNGGKKFLLGAILGGIIGGIAGKFYKTNEKEIKEGVKNKVNEVKSKIDSCKKDEEEPAEKESITKTTK